MTKIQYDLVYYSDADAREMHFSIIFNLLEDLSRRVDVSLPANRRYIGHKKAITFIALAKFSLVEKNYGAAVNYALSSVDEMSAVLDASHLAESDPDFSGFAIEYIESVAVLSRGYEGVQDYLAALRWARIALDNARLLYGSYNGEERVVANKLGKHFLTYAHLCELSDNDEEATAKLAEMKSTLERFNAPISKTIQQISEQILGKISRKLNRSGLVV